MSEFNPIIRIEDDGMYFPEVRQWSFEKWKILGAYCDIFTNGMKNKWDQLVYLDLYAGAGAAKVRSDGNLYYSSPLIALSIPHQFDRYIFCEKNESNIEALKQRVKRYFPEQFSKCEFISGDVNENINRIKAALPPYSKGNSRLAFSFVDPFSLELNFSTIQELGKDLMDFLILLALHMDANRNFQYYIQDNNERIAALLDEPDWRNEFEARGYERRKYVTFIAEKYDEKMQQIGYIKPEQKHQIKSDLKNLPLYYLAFYSKHPRGNDFYKKVMKTAPYQRSLF